MSSITNKSHLQLVMYLTLRYWKQSEKESEMKQLQLQPFLVHNTDTLTNM